MKIPIVTHCKHLGVIVSNVIYLRLTGQQCIAQLYRLITLRQH